MDIDVSKAGSEQSFTLDEVQHLGTLRDDRLRQSAERVQDNRGLAQGTGREFAQYERVAKDPGAAQQASQDRVAPTKMIDPDRGIN